MLLSLESLFSWRSKRKTQRTTSAMYLYLFNMSDSSRPRPAGHQYPSRYPLIESYMMDQVLRRDSDPFKAVPSKALGPRLCCPDSACQPGSPFTHRQGDSVSTSRPPLHFHLEASVISSAPSSLMCMCIRLLWLVVGLNDSAWAVMNLSGSDGPR